MKLQQQITEEAARFRAFYGHKPDHVFLGSMQCAELDAMIQSLRSFGMVMTDARPSRMKYEGMEVFRVDAESHLSFGFEQPSPCG